jgi:heptosyltransferase I
MPEYNFLLVRLGSMGDVIHALPAAAALRDTFPDSRIDWLIDRRWARLLDGNPDLSNRISLNRRSLGGVTNTIRTLHSARYSCAIDFQALYKSALLAFSSGAVRRVGFQSSYAREGLASLFYTDCLNPRGAHKVDHNLTLVEFAGARRSRPRFPITVHPQDDAEVARELSAREVGKFFVLNPGGGWRSKCWPAERYGELHRKLAEHYGGRGVVAFGPGEEGLARQVTDAAGNPAPIPIPLGLGPLMALLHRASFLVAADTGPLHLASALGAPVVGLFGPTDPARNGPYDAGKGRAVIVRNPQFSETTYRRGDSISRSMLSITVDQVFQATRRLLESRE